MRPLAILFACSCVLASAACRADDDPEPKVKAGALEGTWVFSKIIGDGKGAPPGDLELTFKKGKLSIKLGKIGEKSHDYKIDAAKKPAHIDLTDSERNKKVEGIYKIDKGELYLCIDERTGRR